MKTINPQIFYAIPLRDIVIFPHMSTTIVIGRAKSVHGIESAKKSNIPVFAVTQINPDKDEFEFAGIYKVGTICRVVEVARSADGNVKVVLQGIIRGKVNRILPDNDFFSCEVDLLQDEKVERDEKLTGLIKAAIDGFTKLGEYNRKITPEIINALNKVNSPHDLVFLICSFLNSSTKFRQEILEENNIKKKLYKVLEI